MSSADFINGLVATASPVPRRRVSFEVMALLAVAAVQGAGVWLLFAGPAFPFAFEGDPARMMLKISLFAVAAVAFSALTLISLYPSARSVGPLMWGTIGLILVAGVIGFDRGLPGGTVGSALMASYGWKCAVSIVSLSLPVSLALTFIASRGASTQPDRTALLIGLAGGTWGAFAYSLQCPHVSLAYLSVWYTAGVLAVAVAARLLLPRFARW